jgi:hypothetical protein
MFSGWLTLLKCVLDINYSLFSIHAADAFLKKSSKKAIFPQEDKLPDNKQ